MDGVVQTSNSPLSFTIDRLFKGALAGVIATVPMSAFMQAAWIFLPRKERYPLPPRQIINNVTKRLGIRDNMNNDEMVAATLLSHFGYGAAAGSIYALFDAKIPLDSRVKGGLAGVGVWVGSYLGWLPAMEILRPATQHPWRRNLLMIFAHLIWGVTLGEAVRRLTTQR
jgi:uncharacterized membrane protein YagU involved in acid resistance